MLSIDILIDNLCFNKDKRDWFFKTLLKFIIKIIHINNKSVMIYGYNNKD